MRTFIEALGWYGAIAILGAYFLVSFSFLSVDSIWYQILNGTGAVGIVLVSLQKRAFQPALLNGVWMIIAVIAMARMF